MGQSESARNSKNPTLSVIVPIYNERENVEDVISEIRKVNIDKEIIVVDDFSTDGTRNYLKTIKDIKIIYHRKNMGKGSAIRSGLALAQGDVVIIQDADREYSPQEYPKLISPIVKNRKKVVYGSRMLGKGEFLKSSYYANRFLTFLTNILFSGRITDMETCYKVMTKDFMLSLNLISSRFEIEPEITCKILKKRAKIIEIPISYCGRKRGKKIGIKDGIQAVWNILKWKIVK